MDYNEFGQAKKIEVDFKLAKGEIMQLLLMAVRYDNSIGNYIQAALMDDSGNENTITIN